MQVSHLFCMEGWMSNKGMMRVVKVLLLLLVCKSYVQVSTCLHIYTDLMLVEEMYYLSLLTSKSSLKYTAALCQTTVHLFLCLYVWSGMTHEKTLIFKISGFYFMCNFS